MMTVKNLCVLILTIVLLTTACRKDGGDYSYSNTQRSFPGNTYEYLKSNTGRFDSLLLVLDRLHLSDTLKTGKYTLFAPTNTSFRFVLENLNAIRKSRQLPPVYLLQADVAQLDTMMTKYILRQVFNTNDMNYADGISMYTVKYNYPMNGRRRTTNAEGLIGGGPSYLEYSDTRNSKYNRDWVTTTTQSVNLVTTTGIVHVLREDHAFGFDEFILRLNK
ncbi:fasciclin domain-containing protein [Chitinophaga polysaccharea]|uniref:Fasciclin domain-containing protein n=1 Tax=Chitinophaga polysaccharea TaxID=1293035 RepID=A0A561PCB7_9BACT|nr:fasciclin domain-containing protein [Chitinophaga polysaccharea]TWF35696.1 fasciclin domain-containing protein [Chitinophaga polysaccharea]